MAGLEGPSERPDDLLAQLARWSASERTARAVSERSRARALAEQAAAGATWAGLLVDLAESAVEVTVTVGGGGAGGTADKVTGRLVGVGRDFTVLERRAGPVVVRLDAVAALVPSRPGRPQAAGDRRPPLDMGFTSVIDALAAEQSPVKVRTMGEVLAGTLTGSGEDVVTLRMSGAARQIAYVPVRSIAWLELR